MKDKPGTNDFASCPRPITGHDTIQLSHGSGGKLTNQLVSRLFVEAFDNPILNRQDDQAVFELAGSKLAFSTDSYVVDPIFFPGGDIGDLAVNGTINDIAMSGARPVYLSAGFIIEEGLSIDELTRVVLSMQRAAEEAQVKIVTGDTKVVNRGKGDKLFINTSGVGIIEHDYNIAADNLQPGDRLILSGTIADHGMAILSKREGLAFDSPIESDTAALNSLVAEILNAGGAGVHAMRDPTRGGVAASLNEWAESSSVGIKITQERIAVRPAVAGACELLGLDPLYVANEGKLIVSVAKEVAENVLAAMKAHAHGEDAAVFGEVVTDKSGMVSMRTLIGGWRIVDMPVGEQLPRIC